MERGVFLERGGPQTSWPEIHRQAFEQTPLSVLPQLADVLHRPEEAAQRLGEKLESLRLCHDMALPTAFATRLCVSSSGGTPTLYSLGGIERYYQPPDVHDTNFQMVLCSSPQQDLHRAKLV